MPDGFRTHLIITRQIQIYSDQDPLADFYQPFDPVIDSSETYDSLADPVI